MYALRIILPQHEHYSFFFEQRTVLTLQSYMNLQPKDILTGSFLVSDNPGGGNGKYSLVGSSLFLFL
jgi:hypothetical protein